MLYPAELRAHAAEGRGEKARTILLPAEVSTDRCASAQITRLRHPFSLGRKTRANYEKVAYPLAHADPATTPGSATWAQRPAQAFVIVRLTKLARLLLKGPALPASAFTFAYLFRFFLLIPLSLLDCPGRTPQSTATRSAGLLFTSQMVGRTNAFLDLPSGTALNASANSFFSLIFSLRLTSFAFA